MVNPSQSHYSTEELFLLKPEITAEITRNSKVSATPPPAVKIAATHAKAIKNAFWSKYKWHVIVGGIIIAGAGWHFYNENEKKKKSVQKN